MGTSHLIRKAHKYKQQSINMKVALILSLAATVGAFSPDAPSRREVLNAAAAGAAAVVVPGVANAAVGESPRFSVFGIIGDGTSYSEGGAYGSDQAAKTYSAYSVYGKTGDGVYDKSLPQYNDRKKAIVAETKVRVARLDAYIEKEKWFEVINELTRYMYETRGAVRGLAQTPEQKKIATNFFQAIEACTLNAKLKKKDKCSAAAKKAVALLDEFSATI